MEREHRQPPQPEEAPKVEIDHEAQLSAFEKIDHEFFVERRLLEYPMLRGTAVETELRKVIARQLVERRAVIDEQHRKEEAARRRAAARQKAKLIDRFSIAAMVTFGSATVAALAYPKETRDLTDSLNPYHVAEMSAPVKAAPAPEVREQRERVIDLTEMDAEATPERMRRLMSHLPKGWVRDIGDLTFEDREGDIIPNMKTESRAAAVASETDAPGRPTDIIFYRGSKRASREDTFGDTLPHEVAHGTDWVRGGAMTEEQRSMLHAKVLMRVHAPDRFRSAYVEDIDPTKMEQRALEYLPEVFAAYMSHDDLGATSLSNEDVDLVEWHIKLTDPDYDRDKSVPEFRAELRDMRWSELKPDLRDELSRRGADGQDAELLEDWISEKLDRWRSSSNYDTGVMENLTAKVADWATDEVRRAYVESILGDYSGRERLASQLLGRKDGMVGADQALESWVRERRNRSEFDVLKEFGEDGARFTAEVEQLIAEKEIIIGDDTQGALVSLGYPTLRRLEELALRKSGAKKPWAMKAFGWGDPQHFLKKP